VLLRLFILFISVPLVELVLLLYLADLTNWRVPLVTVIVTGIVGAMLAKSQGLRAVARIRRELDAGRLPGTAMVDAVMILVAGTLLLTPGLLTDAFGFSLLVPFCRSFYRSYLVKRFRTRFKMHQVPDGFDEMPPDRSEVIDSYVIQREESDDDSANHNG